MSVGRALTVTSREMTSSRPPLRLTPTGVPSRVHGHVRLDGLGEVDLLEVDVGHEVLDPVELELLDDRDVGLGLAFDHDVEHGVHAGAGADGASRSACCFDGDAHVPACPSRTGRPG